MTLTFHSLVWSFYQVLLTFSCPPQTLPRNVETATQTWTWTETILWSTAELSILRRKGVKETQQRKPKCGRLAERKVDVFFNLVLRYTETDVISCPGENSRESAVK